MFVYLVHCMFIIVKPIHPQSVQFIILLLQRHFIAKHIKSILDSISCFFVIVIPAEACPAGPVEFPEENHKFFGQFIG